MIVVSDTSPICYLLLIDKIQLLSQLYGQVLIPKIVQQELSDNRSPMVVQNWINNPPEWLIIHDIKPSSEGDLALLDAGEQAAILLAVQQKASLIIIDDALARRVASDRSLKVIGLLGVLDEAAKQNLINFSEAITSLKTTTFRASSQLIDALLKRYSSNS